MLFEQYHSQDLLTPPINNDGGVSKLNSSLTALDFYLLDDIDTYLSPVQSKKNQKDLINDSNNDNNEYHDDFFSNFDFSQLNDFEEKSDFLSTSISIDDLDIEKWIKESSFPSPPMDTNDSPLSSIEDTSTTLFGSEYTQSLDMVVPPSPPLSTASSSPKPITKKPKLTLTERKLRKKGQNKNAAEKYRVRKKSERHHLLDQHSKLKNTNKELKLELENLTYRVQHIKQLFADLLQIDPSSHN